MMRLCQMLRPSDVSLAPGALCPNIPFCVAVEGMTLFSLFQVVQSTDRCIDCIEGYVYDMD